MEGRRPIQWCPDTYWNHSSFSKHRQVVFRKCFTPSIFWFFIWPLQRANGKERNKIKRTNFLIFSFMSENHMEKNCCIHCVQAEKRKCNWSGLTMEGLQQTTPKLSTKTMNNQTCKTKGKRNNLGDPWLWVKRISNIFLASLLTGNKLKTQERNGTFVNLFSQNLTTNNPSSLNKGTVVVDVVFAVFVLVFCYCLILFVIVFYVVVPFVFWLWLWLSLCLRLLMLFLVSLIPQTACPHCRFLR